jgi:hypothetical protein
MSNDLQIDDGWYEELKPLVNSLIMKATAAICSDAKEICPVDTGALKASLTPINSAPMQGRVISHMAYCAAVELGFHGEEYVRPHMRQGRPVRGFTRRGNSPEQPYLRPALYRTRNLSEL